MLDTIYKVEDSVDVYLHENDSESVTMTFYKITTRDRIEISVHKVVAEFVAFLDGSRTPREILQNLGEFEEKQAIKLLSFLLERHIANTVGNEAEDKKYKRQITFFNDFVLEQSGMESQHKLTSKKVVLMGCGAVNSAIAETLARMGVTDFVLFDSKTVSSNMLDRHLFLRKIDIGKTKVRALADFLQCINSSVVVQCIEETLLPVTDLSNIIPKNTNLVINSCDEPYIGHTSMKIGRYLQELDIPLFIAGGFDAHLMSSGELIYPPKTPCIDCCQATFQKALSDWKPTYTNVIKSSIESKDYGLSHTERTSKLLDDSFLSYIGGSGGLASQSYYAAYIACMRIIPLLLEDNQMDWDTIRTEYLLNQGISTESVLEKQEGCHVCNQ